MRNNRPGHGYRAESSEGAVHESDMRHRQCHIHSGNAKSVLLLFVSDGEEMAAAAVPRSSLALSGALACQSFGIVSGVPRGEPEVIQQLLVGWVEGVLRLGTVHRLLLMLPFLRLEDEDDDWCGRPGATAADDRMSAVPFWIAEDCLLCSSMRSLSTAWLKVGSPAVDADVEMLPATSAQAVDDEREASRRAAWMSVSNFIPMALQWAS